MLFKWSFLILGTGPGGYHILIGNLVSATLMCRWAFSCGADLLANDGAGKSTVSLVWSAGRPQFPSLNSGLLREAILAVVSL